VTVEGGFGAALTFVSAVVIASFSYWLSRHKDRVERQRAMFAEAYATCLSYREMPFAIRRRSADRANAERLRLSEEIRSIQAKLAFYTGWLALESRTTSIHYNRMLSETRKLAGKMMHDA
jgi:hypothetical protein